MTRPNPAWQIRPINDDELSDWTQVANRAFLADRRPSEAGLAFSRRRIVGQRLLTAVDGARLVSTFRSYDVELPVPGGTVSADAVSSVTVAASHRRRGILRAMLDADLAAAKERGTVLAVLIAAEASIYGRFGFGAANEGCRWTLDSPAAQFRENPVADGEIELELVEDADLRDVAPAVYAAAAAGMPGAMPRDELWWDRASGVVDAGGDDLSLLRPGVIARDQTGVVVGTASYRAREVELGRRPHTSVELLDLSATTPAGYLALWRFLAEIDLTIEVTGQNRPVHEVLPWLLLDPRAAAQTERADFQWIRLLDLPAALKARRYPFAASLVLDVIDDAGFAGGRVRLDVDESGRAEVTSTNAEPDVVLGVAALGSVYLGQISLTLVHAAGLVDERSPGAVAKLGALMSWAPTASINHTWF